MKNQEVGIYMLICSIILLVFVLGLAANQYDNNKETYFGDVKIKPSQLNEIIKILPEGIFVLCNMNENKCVLSQKRNLV